ncbi:MAG TPA: HAD-IIIA family hydrolase [Candidatus Thermoplasmatota archaeon]|nr:HAD-IIIA family hydrolase [Candidatus Thermoplasmatota archaeon]
MKPRGRRGKPSEPFTVFLDRDGVFNRNLPLGVRLYRNLEWLPGARESFARLNEPWIRTCLVTNQPWVGLLTATPGMIRRLHARFRSELERAGGRLDRIEAAYAPAWWPHRRLKPRPGMLEDGAAALEAGGWRVRKERAVMVGDKLKDAEAAAAFGIPCILLATTSDAARLEEAARRRGVPYAAIAPDLETAVDLMLDWAKQ